MELKKLFSDTVIYGLSSIVGKFLNYLLVPLYTYKISAASGGYGVITNIYAYTALLLVILTFGMETTFFYFANKKGVDSNRAFSTALISVGSVAALFVLLCFVFISPISSTLGYSAHPEYLKMMACVVAIDAFQAILFAFLRFKGRAWKFAILKLSFIVCNIGLNLFIFLVAPHWAELHPAMMSWYDPGYQVGYVFLVNLICTAAITLGFIPELRGLRYGLDTQLLKQMLRYTWPLLLLGIVGILNQVADKICFRFIVPGQEGEVQLGIYGACVKIAMIMAMITQAFRYAYEPFVFGSNREAGSKESQAVVMKYFVMFTLLAFLAVVCYIDVFKYVIDDSYWEGLRAVPIVMLAEIFMGIYFNLSFWYKLIEKTWWGAIMSAIGCVVMLAVNFIFVPVWGYMACAWGGFAGYGVCMLLSYFIGRKYNPVPYDVKSILGYFALALVLYGCSMWLKPARFGWELAFNTLLLLVYVGALLYGERILVKSVWKRIAGCLVLLALITSCGGKVRMSAPELIPEPVFYVQKEHTFTLSHKTKLCFERLGQNTQTAKYISKSLRQMHVHPALSGTPVDNCLVFSLNDTINTEIGDEGYLLEVQPSGVYVSANTEIGLFYGYQTFVQMLPTDISTTAYTKIELPECTVLDYPRFEWRGCHLDVSRHFFSMKELKRYIDVMAAYKMNKLHLHLTDDQGWRLEIEKYPNLTTVGVWRVDRSDVPWGEAQPAQEGEVASYGGFYSKANIAELVEYAALRHIEIIPEIDIPGHCSAVLAAYPQFSCDGGEYQVAVGPYWPPKAVLCAGNDSVLQFLCDVMDEVMEMFPSHYIHIGGNETLKENWESCPHCQARMRKEQLKTEEQLQGWLIRQVERYVNGKGREIIGWDEIIEGGVSRQTTVMAWRGSNIGVAAARKGISVIMTPSDLCNFDCYQAEPEYQQPAMGDELTLRKAYRFDPLPSSLTEDQARYVKGGQCNMWTEYINTPDQLEYMLLPRLCAMSECLWTPVDKKDWPRFRRSVESHKRRLSKQGYKYCEGSFKPILHVQKTNNDSYRVSLETEVANTYVFYTLDGSEPTQKSQIYVGTLTLKEGTTLKTLSVYNGEPREGVYEFEI